MQNLGIHLKTAKAVTHDSCTMFSCDLGLFAVVTDSDTSVYWWKPKLKDQKLLATLDDSTRVVSLKYVAEIDLLVFAMESGNMYTCSLDGLVENVGTIEQGIDSMEWSLDNELFLIATKEGNCLEMTRNFDVLYEFPINQSEFGTNAQVNVGWGRKETQFHGKAGKEAAKVANVVTQISKDDSLLHKVCWRFDGSYFCVSSVDEKSRKLRVFSRDSVLLCTSEPVNQLEDSLSWRPSGNLIASAQTLPNGTKQVVFFEKNGLRHGEFTLESSILKIHEIKFSADSLIMSLLLTKNVNGTTMNVVQLYTVKNFHYYLKQEFTSTEFSGMCWDEIDPILYLIEKSGLIKEVRVNFQVDANLMGTVAVVDGRKLLVTPFQQANVPPPMSLFNLEFDSNISGVSFSDTRAVCWLKDSVHLIDLNNRCVTETRKLTGNYFCLFNDSLVFTKHINGKDHLQRDDELIKELNGITIITHGSANNLLVSTDSGQIYELDQFFNLRLLNSMPSTCEKIQQLENGQIVGLDLKRTRLYLDSQVLLSTCTSFCIQSDFIVATTLDSKLEFINLTAMQPIKSRQVEQGALIVTIVPETRALVLQMPRGNLETIYPRPLLISRIKGLLQDSQFKHAFGICRRNRIDLDILYDADKFTRETWVTFVQQINNADHLNLFLTSVKEKVNQVCEEMLVVVPDEFVTTRITCYARQSPPKLEQALEMIRSMSHKDAQDALKYLIFLVNVDEIFNTALGMYDFELVVMVAKLAQKDPREYQSFIRELSVLPENRQKFQIDHFLERRIKALGWLNKCYNDTNEFLDYMKKYKLYSNAMDLVDENTSLFESVCLLYAQHLESSKKLYEAAIMYKTARNCEKSVELFTILGLYDHLTSEQVIQVLPELVQTLVLKTKYLDASRVLIDYSKDYSRAINVLIDGKEFMEAIRLANLYSVSLAVIQEGAISECNELLMKFTELKSEFIATVERLNRVRVDKIENLDSEWDPLNPNLQGDVEVLSDTVSMATSSKSRMSLISIARSSRTARGRRRLEKKKNQSRKGGLFEEEFLMKKCLNVAQFIKSKYGKFALTLDSFKLLVQSLIYLKQFKLSKQFIEKHNEFVEFLEDFNGIVYIYPPNFSDFPESLQQLKSFILENTEADPLTLSMLCPMIQPVALELLQYSY